MKAFLLSLWILASLPLSLAHAEGAKTLHLKSSGENGTKGDDGSDGSDGFGAGGSGTSATKPGIAGTPGGKGGNVELKLRSDGQGYIGAWKMIWPFATKEGETRADITAPITIEANGGNGGEGGRGGDGGDGRQGYTGSTGDARAGIPGGTGGPGGNGGDATGAGAGGDAGGGGDILIIAPFEDIHLFSLLQSYSNKAGTPGKAGRAGRGGSAGGGGPGGDGGSYDEVIHHSEDGTEVVENKDGSTTLKPYTRKWDETVTHYGTDGSSGPSGISGSDGSSARDGLTARDGNFAFLIEGRTKRYTRLYNLSRGLVRIVDKNDDGIFEPGEQGYLEGLVVRNSGYMPSPPPGKSKTRIFLPGDAWHRMSGPSLELPKSLDEDESYQFSEKLGFRVAAAKGPSVNRPLHETMRIKQRAIIDPVNHYPSDFNSEDERDVKYPIVLRLEAPPALAQGERGRVRFIVTNVSNKAIGLKSDQLRPLSVYLAEVGKHRKPFTLVDELGKPISLGDGVNKPIELLKPNDSKVFEGSIEVPDDFEDQSAFTFKGELNLGSIDDYSVEGAIQREVQRISVATKYHTDVATNIALIINSETRKEVVEGWRSVLEKELGFSMVSWNPAYYGNFDLDKEIVANPRWHLMKDLAGKSVLVLNSSFKNHSANWVRSWEQLSKEAVLRATGNKDINFHVLGPMEKGDGVVLASQLIRTQPGEGSREYPDTDSLVQGLDILHRDRLTYKQRSQIREDFHVVNVRDWYYWKSPQQSELVAKARDLARQLRTLWPSRHYLVSHDYRGAIVTKGGTFSSHRVDLGDLIVQRLPDRHDPVVMMSHVDDDTLNKNGDFPSSERGLDLIVSGLSYEDKVGLLDRLIVALNGNPSDVQLRAAEALKKALVGDILEEYRFAILGATWRGHASPRTIGRLAEWRFQEKIKPGSKADELIRWIHVRASIAGYHSYSSFPWAGGTAKPACQGAVEDLDRWLRHIYDKKDFSTVKTAINKDWNTFKSGAKASGFFMTAFSWNSTLEERIRGTIVSELNTELRQSSANAALESMGDVIDQKELNALHAEDQRRRILWEQALKANLKARSDLKLPSVPKP